MLIIRLTHLVLLLIVLIGCAPTPEEQVETRLIKRAKVTVKQDILKDYPGTYLLPNGASFKVSLEKNQLLAGTPPYQLLPQTTREFVSNRSPAVIKFKRNEQGEVEQLNFQLAKRDLWVPKVETSGSVDPTQLVDAGGHKLRMLISGTKSPTVIIEDGFGSSIELRCELQAMLSKFCRVVTYDHAGTGGSEPGPQPRHGKQIARELRLALRNANIHPPFFLVGGSIGGDYLRIFAHEYPKDVLGIVMLDPTPDWEELNHWAKQHAPAASELLARMSQLGHQSGSRMMAFQEMGRQQEWAQLAITREQAKRAFHTC